MMTEITYANQAVIDMIRAQKLLEERVRMKRSGSVYDRRHKESTVRLRRNHNGTDLEEGGQINVPDQILLDKQVYVWEGTNQQVLASILNLGGVAMNGKVTSVKTDDVIICIGSITDPVVRKYKGTSLEILKAISQSKGRSKFSEGTPIEEKSNSLKLSNFYKSKIQQND